MICCCTEASSPSRAYPKSKSFCQIGRMGLPLSGRVDLEGIQHFLCGRDAVIVQRKILFLNSAAKSPASFLRWGAGHPVADFTLLFQILCILLRRNAKLLELADKKRTSWGKPAAEPIRDGTVVLAKHRKRVVNTNAADIVGDRHMDVSAEKSGQVIRTDMDLLCQLGTEISSFQRLWISFHYLRDTIHRGAGQMFSPASLFQRGNSAPETEKLHDSSV